MMQTSPKIVLSGLLVASAVISHSTYAATVSTIGSFNDPTATAPLYFVNHTYNQDDDAAPAQTLASNTVSGTNSVGYFGWGIDVIESIIEGEVIQSHFWFNGAGSVAGGPATMSSLGTAFSLGTFTYTNEQTILSGGIVEIDFQMDINIDGLLLSPVEYRLEINNTRNGFSNPFDTARLIGTPDSMAFMLDGAQYLLTFNGFSRDGGTTFETVANLAEGGQTSAQIYATITAVPVPAAIWLMAGGLLALFGFARSKS